MTRLEGGKEEIEDEEREVPGDNEDVDKETGDFLKDAHARCSKLCRVCDLVCV